MLPMAHSTPAKVPNKRSRSSSPLCADHTSIKQTPLITQDIELNQQENKIEVASPVKDLEEVQAGMQLFGPEVRTTKTFYHILLSLLTKPSVGCVLYRS